MHSASYEKHISITEWFNQMNHARTAQLHKEDSAKRERLSTVSTIIDLPFDKPYHFLARDVTGESHEFKQFVREHGKELCALHLIPHDTRLPTLHIRGNSVLNSISWFKQQPIDHLTYKVDFIPHPTTSVWSSIFIVNNKGIFGEVIRGEHNQLTQGFHGSHRPIQFAFDSQGWRFSVNDADARSYAQKMITFIHISSSEKRWLLEKQVGATFFGDYMRGYFETSESLEHGLWFIDYNQLLAELYADYMPHFSSPGLLSGQPASEGKIEGVARLVSPESIGTVQLGAQDILVCTMTTFDYCSLMQQAGGIITSGGGILSHAAIVARELGKPCIVGVNDFQKVLRDGDRIELDADRGSIRRV